MSQLEIIVIHIDKYNENCILHGKIAVVKYIRIGGIMLKKDLELYNTVYKELAEMIGYESMIKIYLRFKGQQITFPVRLYNPNVIQQNVINEFDGTNIADLAKKYDYSERTIRRMISPIAEYRRLKNFARVHVKPTRRISFASESDIR